MESPSADSDLARSGALARGATFGLALLLVLLGLDAFLHGTRGAHGRALCGLLFLALPLALLLEPRPGRARPSRRSLLATLGAALAAALLLAGFGLAAAGWLLPPSRPEWLTSPPNLYVDVMRDLEGRSLLPALLIALLALPVALPLLLVRQRTDRIEWQVVAAAVGGLYAVMPLAVAGLPPNRSAHVLALGCLACAQAGVASCVVDAKLASCRVAWVTRRRFAPGLLVVAALASVPYGLLAHTARPWLVPVELEARPEVEAALRACFRAQARYLAAHDGRCATSLGYLDLEDPRLARGVAYGYLFRYACWDRSRTWALAADPVQPRPGRPHYLIDASGVVRRLDRPTPCPPDLGE